MRSLIALLMAAAALISSIFVPAVYAQSLVGPTPGGTESLTTPGEEDPFASLRELDRQAEQRYQALFNPTQPALSIINGIRQECESANFIGNACVTLQYESPRTVILEGDKQILDTSNLTGGTSSSSSSGGYWPNPFLWQAVDGFKGLGYSVTFVELGGQGSQGNPHDFIVVMEK